MRMVHAFVARTQRVFIEHVALQPDFRFQKRADRQFTAQRTPVDQNFELEPVQIQVDPEQFASGKRVLQWFESYNAATQSPIVFMSGASRSLFFQG